MIILESKLRVKQVINKKGICYPNAVGIPRPWLVDIGDDRYRKRLGQRKRRISNIAYFYKVFRKWPSLSKISHQDHGKYPLDKSPLTRFYPRYLYHLTRQAGCRKVGGTPSTAPLSPLNQLTSQLHFLIRRPLHGSDPPSNRRYMTLLLPS